MTYLKVENVSMIDLQLWQNLILLPSKVKQSLLLALLPALEER